MKNFTAAARFNCALISFSFRLNPLPFLMRMLTLSALPVIGPVSFLLLLHRAGAVLIVTVLIGTGPRAPPFVFVMENAGSLKPGHFQPPGFYRDSFHLINLI